VLLFFDRTASGNASPSRTIEGSSTNLGNGAGGVDYDSTHDEIMAFAYENIGGVVTYRIVAFAGSASGNSVPLRRIEGTLAQLAEVSTIAYDAVHDEILVTEGGSGSVPAAVLAFPRTANGNVAPTRTITGSALPKFPSGVAVVPNFDGVFADGFE